MTVKCSHVEFLNKLKYVNCDISVLEPYINSKTKIKFKCLIDEHEWYATPNNILKGRRCPKCSKHIKLINENVDERLKNRNIKRIDPYINNKTKIKFKCLIDEYEWYAAPGNILQGYGCPICGNSNKLTNDLIDERIKNSNIQRIGSVINAKTKIKFKCLKCVHIWTASPDNVLRGKGCPFCKYGKKEKYTKELIKTHVKYDYFEHHKLFKFNNRKYTPDFYLEIQDKKLIIEYNGMQHYKPVRFGGISIEIANQNFIKQRIRDEELRQFCKDANIYLLEIPNCWKEEKIIEELNKINQLFKSDSTISVTNCLNV